MSSNTITLNEIVKSVDPKETITTQFTDSNTSSNSSNNKAEPEDSTDSKVVEIFGLIFLICLVIGFFLSLSKGSSFTSALMFNDFSMLIGNLFTILIEMIGSMAGQ